MDGLSGKTALVTGGSRGIGRAICEQLTKRGVQVIAHYNRNRPPTDVASRILQADLSSTGEIDRMFAGLGNVRLDFLINNAGVWKGTPMDSSRIEDVDDLLNTNLRAPFWITQRALPLMNDGGRIVNISSVAGRIGVAGGRSLYGATKAGIDSLTQSWALELGPRGILVNAVAPGYITTDMTAGFFVDPAMLASALRRQPTGRLGTPEDVADVVVFLCSDAARFITGQSINVSGGSVI